MTDTSNAGFGAPIKIDPTSKPTIRARGGKPTMRPLYVAWLSQLEPGADYEMASTDADGAHPVARLNSLRKTAKEMTTETEGFKVEAVYVGSDRKRVRIFASHWTSEPNGDEPAAKATKATKATAKA